MTLAEAPRTQTIVSTDIPVPHPRDPLVAAADLLHAAARLPFSMSDVVRWRAECSSRVRHAATSLDTHCWECSDADAALTAVKDEPRLLPGVTRQLCEHAHLREACSALNDHVARVCDTDAAIGVMDECLHLEAEIRRHYANLLDLVFESVNREIGGTG